MPAFRVAMRKEPKRGASGKGATGGDTARRTQDLRLLSRGRDSARRPLRQSRQHQGASRPAVTAERVRVSPERRAAVRFNWRALLLPEYHVRAHRRIGSGEIQLYSCRPLAMSFVNRGDSARHHALVSRRRSTFRSFSNPRRDVLSWFIGACNGRWRN